MVYATCVHLRSKYYTIREAMGVKNGTTNISKCPYPVNAF
ncbi:unnamed protein product [Gongylonema pulchrum]|uniref:Uncharacterized protein n=1 Tax=Gongylonema pulchrum TaxID=637853 RepID=A0A183EIB2_9BILA|nr:unnamed protein product [Gongylonema pulchrum]